MWRRTCPPANMKEQGFKELDASCVGAINIKLLSPDGQRPQIGESLSVGLLTLVLSHTTDTLSHDFNGQVYTTYGYKHRSCTCSSTLYNTSYLFAADQSGFTCSHVTHRSRSGE